jgi:hypothetical protein
MQEEEEAEEEGGGEGGGQGGVEREEKEIRTRARIHKATSARRKQRTLQEKACAKGPRRSIEKRGRG